MRLAIGHLDRSFRKTDVGQVRIILVAVCIIVEFQLQNNIWCCHPLRVYLSHKVGAFGNLDIQYFFYKYPIVLSEDILPLCQILDVP